jgi:hypothetical protein
MAATSITTRSGRASTLPPDRSRECQDRHHVARRAVPASLPDPARGGRELDELIRAKRAGRLTQAELDAALLGRDRRLRLEVDSNQLNQRLAADYARVFPQARFVLTIREPRSWLDSFYDHRLNDTPTGDWKRILDRQQAGLAYPPEEAVLRELGLPPLAARLARWRRPFEEVVPVVPPDRLLVLRTDEIDRSLERLASFVEIDPATLDAGRSHRNRGTTRHRVLARLDPAHVERMIDKHCQPYLRQWFADQD